MLGALSAPENRRRLSILERDALWTNAVLPGYRPNTSPASCPGDPFYLTAVNSLEPHGNGSRYSALVMHADAASCKRHEEIGFRDGWGAALDQLITVAKTM